MLKINKLTLFALLFAALYFAGLNAQEKPVADSLKKVKHQMKEELRTGHKMDHSEHMKGMMKDSSMKHSGHMEGMMKDSTMKHSGHMKGMMKDSSMTQNTVSKTFNKYCPVTGEEVDSDESTIEYKGKTYGFCCSKCEKKFKADPEKYIGNLSPDGKNFVGKTK
jgi:YHS domain-containing protein